MATIIAQIEDIEKMLERCERRLDELERKDRQVEMSAEEWQDLDSEMKQLKKQIKKHQSDLRGLRWQNWKSMIMSVCIFGILYVVYIVVFDSESSIDS